MSHIELIYESQSMYTGNLHCKMYIPVESDSSTKFTQDTLQIQFVIKFVNSS